MFELMRRNNYFDDLENAFFGSPWPVGFFGGKELAAFKTDVTDEGDHFLLEADLPGFDKKDIKLDISGNILTVKAERHSKVEEKDKKNKCVRIERSYGSYQRDFDVSAINIDKIKAEYKDGVLSLTLPKKEEVLPQSKRLEIE